MSKKEEQDRELFNRIVISYARKDIAPASAVPRKAMLLAALRPVLRGSGNLGTLVEVGCGVGAAAKYLQGYYDKYIGIDQSEKMIQVAKTFNLGNSRAEFLAQNIKAAELPGSIADTILVNGALHHMTELDLVMRTLQRLARKGAHIVAVEPQNANPLIQGMRRVRGLVDKAYSRDQVFFSERELAELFFRNGVSDMKVDYIGFLSPPFAQVIFSPQSVFAPIGRFTASVDNWLNKRLPRFLKKMSFNIVISGIFDKS